MDKLEAKFDIRSSPFDCAPDGAIAAPFVGQADGDENAMLASLAAYVASHAAPANGVGGLTNAPPAPHGAEGKRVSAMNEVFVLGRLIARPLHGYLLRQIMSVALGPVRQMNWNTLYPLIHRLVEEGLIEPVDEAESRAEARHGAPRDPRDPRDPREPEDDVTAGEGGRRRKAYRITPAGMARFHELMREQDGYTPDYPDLFNIKLSNFAYVTPTTRLAILRHYQGYLQLLGDYLRAIYTNSGASPGIPTVERPFIQRMIQHRWYMTQADLRWIGEAISCEIAAYQDAAGRADAAVETAR